jgi:hypothetical protein
LKIWHGTLQAKCGTTSTRRITACHMKLWKSWLPKLRPFLVSQREELVNDQVDVKKVVHMVVYRLAHGIPYRHIVDRYGIGPATIT